MKKIRQGSRIKTIIETEYQITEFNEVDNLDTKSISDSKNNYEESFIRIREALQGKPWCCDNDNDVLFICQTIADELRQNLLLRKEDQ